MIDTSYVVVTARAVRIAAAALAVVLLVGFVAVSSFSSHYGSSGQLDLEPRSNEPALVAAVHEQESAGLVCSAKPAATEVVLFQRRGASEVQVLTFGEAIRASSARQGWIRSYCVSP